MARSYVKYNGSTCVQEKINLVTFVRGTHSSVCLQKIYGMTRLHVEHIGSDCLQDMTSSLVHFYFINNFVD